MCAHYLDILILLSAPGGRMLEDYQNARIGKFDDVYYLHN